MGKFSYFVGNIFVQVRHVFLLDYHLILSLLECRGVGRGVFQTAKAVQTAKAALKHSKNGITAPHRK